MLINKILSRFIKFVLSNLKLKNINFSVQFNAKFIVHAVYDLRR